MKNLEIIWIAAGIAFTSATQLRLPHLPIGLGEIMLCAWMLHVCIRISILQHHLITPITRVIFLFWIISFICLSLGLLRAESIDLTSRATTFYHDILAFVFAFIFSIFFSISVSSKKEVKKLLSFFISFTITPQIVLFFIPSLLPFLTPWFGDARFQGWSDNPNQLALVVSTTPFFSFYLLTHSRNQQERIWYMLLMLGSFIVGVPTQTDSLRVGWVVAILVIVFLWSYRVVSNKITTHHLPISNAFAFKQIPLLVLLFITLLLGYITHEKINNIVDKVSNYGSQGNVRFNLWKNGIAAISHSPLFGLGPGAHSGGTEPFFYVQEAHNSFIDWTASFGIIGLICYVTLLGWIVLNVWKSGSIALLAAMISLVVYTIFSYMLRHTIFWFYLLVIAGLSIQYLNQRSISKQNKRLQDSKSLK